MELSLDYQCHDPLERKHIVDSICEAHGNELTPKQMETLSNYLVECMTKNQKKEKTILTENRLATIAKRETSLEQLMSKFENGEDGFYQLVRQDRTMRLSPPTVRITEKDRTEIPLLNDLKTDIATLRALPHKNRVIQQAIIDLSRTQYIIKDAYRQPIHTNTLNTAAFAPGPAQTDWDLTDPKQVAAILHSYSLLRRQAENTKLESPLYWTLDELDRYIAAALSPVFKTVLQGRIDGLTNKGVGQLLWEKFHIKYSNEYISTLFNKKIPQLIAQEAYKQAVLYHYTYEEKGQWKKCGRCGQIKLMHPLFFSRNPGTKSGYYSICKECRNKKR